jgi:myo-inositol 2-dehydrogenase/D-chiro-inositol 1-dehydrogenase
MNNLNPQNIKRIIMEKTDNSFSRRKFLGNAALGAVAAVGASQLLSACSGPEAPKREVYLPPLLDQAPDGEPIRAGLVGCGGRGTGAAVNFLKSGPNLELVALADVFQDRIDRCRQEIKDRTGVEIPDENCDVGHTSLFPSRTFRRLRGSQETYLHGKTGCG